MSLCTSFITKDPGNENLVAGDEKEKKIKEDLDKLHQLAQKYKSTFSELPKIIEEYKTLQRNIRTNVRKLRMKKKSKS